MLSSHEILHEDNYNALCVAICYKQYLSPENAFYVYMTGHMPNLKVVNIKGWQARQIRDEQPLSRNLCAA